MNRRTFLRGSVAGAFVLGFDAGCAFGPAGGGIFRHHKHTGEFQPNAWIRILPDNTIIFTLDRVEMGQGTTTSHAQLVAEELEVAPETLEIEYAEARRAYDNPDKQINIQITGGSTSTAASWQPLREAGAVAREMLRAGAAARWSVPIRECVAKTGRITHARTQRSATYGELVGDAAKQDVPVVRLKDPKHFTLIGKSIDRLDVRPKVDGSGRYGIDIQLPGMVTAVLVRPPVRGASLVSLDIKAALAKRGVVDVFRIGEVVAVLGSGYWEARTGADLVRAEWTGGATVDSEQLFASYRKMTEQRGLETPRNDGDAEGRLGSGKIVEAIYELPYLSHATMEPQNATAWLHDGRCEVWAPTQAPGIARWRVADAIGFDLDDVAIHTTLIGGGFGRRGLVDYAVEAAVVAQRAGRPVKVVFSREDDMENDWYRPMAVSRMRGAVDGKTITAWHHRLVSQSIFAAEVGDFAGALVPNAAPRALRRVMSTAVPRLAARGLLPDKTAFEGAAELPYAIPNLRVEYTPVETGIPVGFWRSVGHSHNGFVTESFLDELIHAAGLDAYHARHALLANHPRHRAVLDLAAEQAGWGASLPTGVGRGIAVHESFHSFCAIVIEASASGARAKVHRAVVAFDCGRVVNPQLVAAQAESAVIFGLSAALKQQVTFDRGRVRESNFNTYKSLRMFECPVIETHIVPSTASPTGIGEPGVPPVAPALCGAIFAATGIRIRKLPVELALAEARSKAAKS
ncbi:MAG: aldehyde oxidase and xanthine dehydrogenase molybdopterin binding protein [Myxococcales bacterium]|nr:aldehyde oxidase and xanthine dehydrogenase molybdopterin binding protein [Myxococcales bacterium]